MIPLRCGQWGHIPFKTVGAFDPVMVLRALGCTLDEECTTHTGWQHFNVPTDWSIVIRERFLYIKDQHGSIRARLADCDPPEITLVRYHSIRQELVDYRGVRIVVVSVVNPKGRMICQAHHMPRRHIGNETRRVRAYVTTLLEEVAPHWRDYSAYWESMSS